MDMVHADGVQWEANLRVDGRTGFRLDYVALKVGKEPETGSLPQVEKTEESLIVLGVRAK